jgi:hypothetical protein
MTADLVPTTVTASELLSKINKLIANITRLKTNASIYTRILLLKEKVNTLEEKVNDFKNNAINSKCTKQCQSLNEMVDQNNVDEFLIQLLLSTKNSAEPSAAPQLLPSASAPPLYEIEEGENESNASEILYPSAPLEEE